MSEVDLQEAAAVIEAAAGVVRKGIESLRAAGPGAVDEQQVLAYDLAHAAAAVETARALLDYGAKGDYESRLTAAFVADATADVVGRTFGREGLWGVSPGALDGTRDFLARYRDPEFLAGLADDTGPRHLDPDFEMVQDAFRRFAEDRIAPRAEHIHRTNDDIPEDIISGLGEMGAFGLSISEAYGGYATGGGSDYLGMVIATEELSRGSLGAGGSLITRPEILARALETGGTEAQKEAWLPRLATGEIMAAVAVTEPDFGSDVANIKVMATPATGPDGEAGWVDQRRQDLVHVRRAGRRADAAGPHRPRPQPHAPWPQPVHRAQGAGGRPRLRVHPARRRAGWRAGPSTRSATGACTPTRCPSTAGSCRRENLIGEESGQGRGFYYQMAGFENGRLQTAARAVGVMQAAYEAGRDYAANRVVFGQPVADFQLTRAKLGRMVVVIQAARQFMYQVGRLLAKGEGQMEASMVKAYVCRAAEWVTREAMQLHGGMGYAEEFPVSRLFVDARVLSIFEGADETLCLKVIARRLVETG